MKNPNVVSIDDYYRPDNRPKPAPLRPHWTNCAIWLISTAWIAGACILGWYAWNWITKGIEAIASALR